MAATGTAFQTSRATDGPFPTAFSIRPGRPRDVSWQRRLYAKQEPSKAFRIWTSVGGSALIVAGFALLTSGGRMVNQTTAATVMGSVLLVLSVPFFFVGLGVILLAWMRWTNPTL